MHNNNKNYYFFVCIRIYRAVMIRSMLSSLESSMPSSSSSQQPAVVCRQMASIMQSDHKLGQKSYKPLLKRPTSSRYTYCNVPPTKVQL